MLLSNYAGALSQYQYIASVFLLAVYTARVLTPNNRYSYLVLVYNSTSYCFQNYEYCCNLVYAWYRSYQYFL